MARMKFLCDAERCIECNGCVPAWKNENEVPWGVNRRRVVTINDGVVGAEKSISVACMHCSDAPCMAVCPVDCFYRTDEGVVLHDKDLCIGCGYCFYACPFGAPQFPQAGAFGLRGKMDKCTFCAGGPEPDRSEAEFKKYGRNRLSEGKLPACAEMCSTKALLGGDGDVIADIYRDRVVRRGKGSEVWGWGTAYGPGKPGAQPPAQQPQAEQPGNNAPVWRDVKSGEKNFTTIKGRETDVLVQPPARFPGQNVTATAGEAWRKFRNGPVTFYGGWLVVLVALAVLAFYFWKGPVELHDRPSGRLIRRFSTLEQVVHWSAAISFCVLGISGLIMLFGKYLLLPVIGYTLFAWLTALGKNLHNFIAPLFIVSVIAMILMWLRDNLPKSYDWMWFGKAWAFFARGEHIPSGRFNAGEKAWFWGGVILLSAIVSGSGIVLLFPTSAHTRAVLHDAWVCHASAALFYIAVSFGHIYR